MIRLTQRQERGLEQGTRPALTPLQVDLLILLAGSDDVPMTARQLASVAELKDGRPIARSLAGLRIREMASFIPVYRDGVKSRGWRIEHGAFNDAEWRRLMSGWCLRHGVALDDVMGKAS